MQFFIHYLHCWCTFRTVKRGIIEKQTIKQSKIEVYSLFSINKYYRSILWLLTSLLFVRLFILFVLSSTLTTEWSALHATRFARSLSCSPNNNVWRVDESIVQAMQRADGATDLWRSSCPSDQAEPSWTACPRPCLIDFWRASQMETCEPPPLWAICTSAWLSAQ